MRRTLSRAAALAGLVLGSAALAQPPQVLLPQPRINSAFPTGAQAGTTVEVTVTGADLDDAESLLFSHPDLKAEVVRPPEPKPDPKAKQQMAKKGPPATSAKFKVTVPAGVPVGQYDLRVVNHFGVSNPRPFVVGDRPEVDELEPNDDAQALDPSAAALAGGSTTLPPRNAPRAQRVELGTTVNGVISTATDVDYVVFTGSAGQRVLVSCLASSIDSQARPLVEVYDPAGRRIGQNRNYRDTDALCDVTLPAAGDYFVRVSEFAYQRGGPDFYYRLTVGVGPWVDAVFPPAVNPGKPTPVTVYGRNLPGGKPVTGMHVDGRPVESVTATVTPPTDPAAATRFAFRGRVAPAMGLLDAFEFRLPSPQGLSNPVPVFLTDAKVQTEKEAGNDRPESAEPIAVPGEVAGRIDRRGDRDFYTFTAKKGDVYFIEGLADRIGGVSDLFLRVRNEKNADLAGDLDDDTRTLNFSFPSSSVDPQPYRFTAPADGKYLVLVGANDASVSHGARCPYRLRITAPRPDFRAVVVPHHPQQPSAEVLRAGGEVAYRVMVARTDGFTGPVTAAAAGLPAGVTAKPALVGTDMTWGMLVLSAAAGAKDFTGPITVTCTATIDGKPVVREARPATITWGVPQPNVFTVTRLDQQLVLAVRGEPSAFRLAADLARARIKTKGKDGKETEAKLAGPIFVKPGDKLSLPVTVAWQEKGPRPNPLNLFLEPVQANLQQAPLATPGGGNNPSAVVAKDKPDVVVTVDVRANAAPGTYALVFRGETQLEYLREPDKKDKKTNVTHLGFTPPVEVTVLPTSLAKLTVQPPANNALKPGATADLTVKVERQFEYAGAYAVAVELPKDAKGVAVKAATIPAGKDEVKVPVAVAKDAKPGTLQNVVVRVTATVHEKFPVTSETKVNLTVAK